MLETSIDTIGGTIHVRNSWRPALWRLEPATEIGAVDEGPFAFGEVRSVLLGPGNKVYIADRMAARIQVFDSIGRHVRTIGRRGGGPSEFGELYALGWLGDTLLTMDPRNARLGLFSRDGDWLGSWRWQPLTGPPVRFHRAGKDEIYAPVVVSRAGAVQRGFARYVHDGPADTLIPPSQPQGLSSITVCPHPEGGGFSYFDVPFAGRFVTRAGPDGTLALATSDAYRISFVGPGGDTLRIVEREAMPLPIGDEEWEREIAEYREFRARNSGIDCEPDQMPRPAHKPAFRMLFWDTEGRLWGEAFRAGGFTFEIFDPEGRLIAEAAAPERDPDVPPHARGDAMVMVRRDSLGVQYVRRYEILRGT
jgi:hypothetical protein